jgi:octaprenyl-diphosphate synthase
LTHLKELRDLLAPVRAELEQMADQIAVALRPESEELAPLVGHVARYRGKQLRGGMVLLTARALGKLVPEHVQVAVIVEMIHTATLVHDDVLDNATMRRKLSTINVIYGNEVPVLLGDYIYAKAFNLSVNMEDQTCSRVLSEVTRTICQGEITQILQRDDLRLTEQRYLGIIGDKTASLYGAACELGAYHAGGDPGVIERFKDFGYSLGVAFQIVDDCLDLEGEESVVGKSLGTDLAGGKMTLPVLWCLRRREGDPSLQELLRAGRDGDLIGVLRRSFDLEGGLSYAHSRAEDYIQRARRALEGLPPSDSLEALRSMADYVLTRRH